MWKLLTFSGNYFSVLKDLNNTYFINSSGIDILNNSYEELGFINVNNLTCAYTDDNTPFLHLGTSGSGIFRYSKDKDIVESTYLSMFKQTPQLSSNYINYLHCLSDSLSVATTSGVNFIENNQVYKSLLTSPIDQVKTTISGIYYSTTDALFYKEYPIINLWVPNYYITNTGTLSITGTILDFDIVNGIIGLLTSTNGYIIVENKNNISTSISYDISSLVSGSSHLLLDNSSIRNGSTIYGTLYLIGSSGIKTIDLESLTLIEEIQYPVLYKNNIVDLVVL